MYTKTCQWNEIDETKYVRQFTSQYFDSFFYSDVSLRNERVIAVERLCEVTAGILSSKEAAKLKQLILDSGVVAKV